VHPQKKKQEAAKERDRLRRDKFTDMQLCNWMRREEKRKGVQNSKKYGGGCGSFAIWFPRSKRTGNILPPPRDAHCWGFFEDRWILKSEV